MWNLIWKSSFHYEKGNYSIFTIPMIWASYMNLLIIGNNSKYHYIFGSSILLILTILTLFPVKLAKGLYLCPLTESERKKYLVTACFFRLVIMMLLFGLILMVSRLFLEVNSFILLIQFIYTGFILLGSILLSLLPSYYASDIAIQKYYFSKNLPVPVKPKMEKEERKTTIHSNILLITTIILAWIGVLLPMNDKEFNMLLWLYYIPSFLVSSACIVVFFMKYFDEVITFNANHEMYHYIGKKKAGTFHAD